MTISLIIFLLILQSWFRPSAGNPTTDLITRSCREAHPQNLTAFLKNFVASMDRVDQLMEREGFGMAYSGDPPDGTYIMAQCFGDLFPAECSACHAAIGKHLLGCFPAIGGRVYLEGCFIRADNYSFFHEISTKEDKRALFEKLNNGSALLDIRCGQGLRIYRPLSITHPMTVCGLHHGSDEPIFSGLVRRVLDKSVKQAPLNEGYGFGFESSTNITLIASANCWKTLDNKSCSVCLGDAAKDVSSCSPATEGRAVYTGCFIRYSDFQFINFELITNDTVTSNKNSTSRVIEYSIYGVGLFMYSVVTIFFGLCIGRLIIQRIHKETKGKDNDSLLTERNLHFKYSTLEKATNFFNDSNKLGQGGFGEVYKGTLADGREIAIKRLFVNATSQGSQVYDEVNMISRVQHKNLVRLLGCSLTSLESVLVYEFVPNRSLDLMLFDPERKKELDWKKRLDIIIGIAEGLKYLHKDCEISIVHRDIKASNILLNLRYRPKIADFGLARFSADRSHTGTPISGTLGYMAPEYITHGYLTDKVDVYSYGVLVLEIISSEQNNKLKREHLTDTLVAYAWKHFQSNTVSEIMDESIEVDDIDEVSRVAQVGLLCTQESPSQRPSMTQIIQFLGEKDLQLPSPSRPPFVDEYMELSLASDTLFRHFQQTNSSDNHHMNFESP